MAPTPETAAPGAPADPMLPRPYRIDRQWRETADTFTLDLAPAHGIPAESFLPGQFNMLYVFGTGEVPISVSGDPAAAPMLRHTTRAVGTVTRVMSRMKKGETIGVRGPFGTHWPVDEAEGCDLVIVAGGIGLAPLRPALYRVMARRERYGRVILLYGTRTPDDILYENELKQWRGKLDLEIHVTVDRASNEWRGNVGVVTKMITRAPFDPSNAVALVCGPEVMMRFTLLELQRRGVAVDRIHVSMERNMKCAVGFCGHCQYGPMFICRDGPVFRFDRIQGIFGIGEV